MINLVLTPGYMLDEDLWAEVRDGLAALGHLTFADFSQDGAIEDLARRLLADAPPTFVLIGFSMGGYVAREAVRQAPDRVTALAQIATSARGDTELQAQRKASIAGAAVLAKFGGLSRAAIVSSLAPEHADEAMIERVRAMGERLGPQVFRRQSSIVRVSDADWLGEIACPTLVVAVAQDQLRSLDEAREIHAGIPGSTLAVIQDSGHLIPLEQPAALLDVLVPWISANA